jgi:hypothetical protein
MVSSNVIATKETIGPRNCSWQLQSVYLNRAWNILLTAQWESCEHLLIVDCAAQALRRAAAFQAVVERYAIGALTLPAKSYRRGR